MKKPVNWKKIGIWAGIIVVLVIGVFVTIKLVKVIKNNRIIKKASGALAPVTNNYYDKPTKSNPAQPTPAPPPTAPPPTAPPQSVLKTWNDLKIGDHVYATELTRMYTTPSFSAEDITVFAAAGDYVGQVTKLTKNKAPQVYNGGVKWEGTPASQRTTIFYIPYKNYKVGKP